MATRLVLHPASDLVEHEVRELHDMKRVRDLSGVREHRVEHRPIRTRQIQRRPADPSHPLVGLGCEPSTTARSVTTRHDVEELASGDADDLGRPTPMLELALPTEQHLVEANRCCLTDAVRVINECSSVVVHGIHHRVPITAKISCHL